MKKYVSLHPELIRSEQITSEVSIRPFKNEILEYLQTLEGSCTTLNSSMIDNQPEINWSMRPYIIDFIMELHLFFKLSQETFFLACFIADKYCCKRIVYKRHYQLLAATSLWIAAKYQDKKTRIPTLRELALLCRQIYEPKMFFQMEKHILSTLEWSVGSLVSTFDVVQWLLSTSSMKTLPKNTEFLSLTSFLCDLTLYEREFMNYTSSVKAISVLLLACKVIQNDSFSQFLNQLIDNQIKWDKFENLDDLCFHIAGDSLSNDLSLSLNAENFQSIRKCLYYLIKEIFQDKNCDDSMVNQRVILKKYKKYPITHWLYNFRKEHLETESQLTALSNSLNLGTITPYADAMTNWIWESILNSVDKLVGLQRNNDLTEEDELMIDDDFSQDLSLLSSQSSSYVNNNDFNIPPHLNCTDVNTPTTSSTSSSILNPSTPVFQNLNNYNGTVRHTKAGSGQNFHNFPPTPLSANSTFSNRPRLSTGSSVSSVSPRSSTSDAFKKPLRSNTRHSRGNNHLVILRESSNQSDYFD
ncbi:hypothetical protein ZYGR_0W00260 [Zygosaccharomyces rouxii]|uniref:Cyclin-like domain-containing protein n=1 Tax=Zygosaccharomyces rouxii TaxID=4956 RepID=A0A1Q3A4J5_ZYGRO|nr:hypothetical protein ZYGR_0W00260 [Zygosaccharomyces rouxii]